VLPGRNALGRRHVGERQQLVDTIYVPWSRFVAAKDVRFEPTVDRPDTLIVDCLNLVHGVGDFCFTRESSHPRVLSSAGE
jgi:hypothetical protein